jgi:acetylornithine/N-succinyldiaminopimelate aminotransferase
MARERQHLMRTYARTPVVLVRGQGCRVWDAEGRSYLDFLAGIGVNNVGHCHPRVVAAVREQAGLLLHTSNLYYTEPQVALAERLAARTGGDARVFFCNSGAEANEAAIKLARKAAWRRGEAGRVEVLTFSGAFHGRTYGALAATARGRYQEGFGPLPEGFRELPFGDAAAVAAAVSDRTCAVLVEPVQGEGGVRPASPEFLRLLRRLCDQSGACLIFDEVQCGLGRTGRFWAFEHAGVLPDVVTAAKSLGGGLPIGAVVARGAWGEVFQPGDHATTFGGGPLICRAALAALDAIEEEDLPARAAELGAYLLERLRSVAAGLPFVREVRGLGLMVGIELAFPGAPLVEACRRRGLLVNCTAGTVLRLLPPLVVSRDEIDEAVGILEQVLRDEAPALAGPSAG